MTMPPLAEAPEDLARISAAPRAGRGELAQGFRWGRHRTIASLPKRVRPSFGSVPILFRGLDIARVMGVGEVWTAPSSTSASSRRKSTGTRRRSTPRRSFDRVHRERPNVRRLHGSRRGRGGAEEFEDWSEPDDVRSDGHGRSGPARRRARQGPLEAVASANVRVHLVVPRELHGRPGDRGQVQGICARDPESPGDRRPPLEAAHRLLESADLRAERLDAARSPTRCSCSPRGTSRSPPRSARDSSSAALQPELTRRNLRLRRDFTV